MTSTAIAAGLIGVSIGLVGNMFSAAPALAATGIYHGINFQGKVVNSDGTNIANGTYAFTFKMYSVSSGGSAVWTEVKSLVVTDGIFQTNLGDTTTLPGSVDFNTDNIFLGINFNPGAGYDGEMTPRIQFTAAAYAFNSEKLGGLTASQFAQLSPGTAQSGFLNVTGNVTSGATIAATTSLQAPLVDTASAVALNVGTATASSVTVGRATSSTTTTIQGSNASTWTATGASGTTTVGFTAPTANATYNFGAATAGTYTICTTFASSCSATYQAAGSYLAKNANDTSTASFLGQLYSFSNSNSGAAGVLTLTNSGTGSALSVASSGNPSAGNALILANNTNGTPSGNLIDLQVGGSSRFSVNTAGAVSTSSTINSQTISATASFTGTVAIATSVSAPIHSTADSTSGTTANLVVRSGNASVGSNLSSGSVTIDSGTKTGTGTAGAISIGTTNASGVTLGAANSTAAVAIQGSASSNWVVTGASGSTTVNFAAPTAAVTYSFGAATVGSYTVCTTFASSCSSVYQAAGSYIAKNAADSSSASFLGNLLALTNSNSGAAGVLALTNSGTNSALNVTQSGNPSSGQAVIYGANTNGSPSGNLLDLQASAASKFSVNYQGNVTAAGTVNSQTISSAASFTGTVAIATSVSSPLHITADSTVANTAALSIRSGNASVGTNLSSGSVTIDSGTKTGTGTTGAVSIGATNASGVTLGAANSTAAVAIQGSASSSWVVTGASGTTTLNFTAPTAAVSYSFGTAAAGSYNICTTVAASCSSVYQAAGSYLAKNAADSSSASFLGNLLGLTNSNAGASGVLALTGSGTNSALNVAQSGNPSSGQAVIYAANTNGSPSGNLLDLQASSASKFSVNYQGNVAASGTINSQTISAAASFTGTVAITTSVSAPLHITADSTVANTAGLVIRSGNATVGTNLSSGSVTIDSGTKTGTGTTGAVSIGATNASGVTLGAASSSAAVAIQGSASSSWMVTGASGSTTVNFTAPTAAVTYSFGAATAGSYGICTTYASSCSSVYQAAGSYLAKNASDTSSASFLGNLLSLTNSSSGASGVLSLTNAGSSSALTISQSGNAGSGQALILANNTNGTPSGNLIDLQAGGVSKFNVNYQGNITSTGTINSQTISSTASFTGTVAVVTGLTVPLVQTADSTAANTAAIVIRSGNATVGSNLNSGNVTIDSGTKTGTGTTGSVLLGSTNASVVTVGNAASTLTLQGNASTTLKATSGANTTTVSFTSPSGTNAIAFPDAGGTICTTIATTCSSVYAAAGGTYLTKNANDTSSASYLGQLYSFTNSNAGAAGVLSLISSGTNSALNITQSGNPTSGQALIFANNTNGTPSGNLLDLQAASSSKFSVTAAGIASAATSVITPLLDASSATLGVGTGTTTGITLGKNGSTVSVPSYLNVSGNSTTAVNSRINVTGTLNSNVTTAQAGIINQLNIAPSGGSVASVNGIITTPTVSINTALAVPGLYGTVSSVGTAAAYTGLVSSAAAFVGNAPAIAGSQLFTNYSGILLNNNNTNTGNTTGTINNYQLQIAANTASAGSGGTLNNYAINIVQPSGSGGTATNNYGLYISGAGAGTANYSIYNSSSAPSYYAGNVTINTTSNPSNYPLNVSGTIGATDIVATASVTGVTLNGTTRVVSPLLGTADSTATSTGAVIIRSGNATVGTNLNSGNITIDSGTHTGTGASGNVLIGQTNAGAVLLGNSTAQFTMQGAASTSSIIANAGANSTTLNFATPTAAVTYSIPTAAAGSYGICTTVAASCSATFQAAGNYLAQNSATAVTSTSNFVGTQYTFIQNNTGASSTLALQNAGTSSAFRVTQSTNPTAGQALILANNTNGTPSGNLLDLQSNAVSQFSVSAAGAVATTGTINGQTISAAASFTGTVTSATGVTVTTGGITVTGNSTITGTLGGLTGLTVASGGASITGAVNLNSSGITNAGSIAGATTIAASTSVSAPILSSADTSTASTNSGAVAFRSGNATGGSSNSGAVTLDAGSATGTAGSLTIGGTNASSTSVGRTGAALTLQGNGSTTLTATNAGSTTALQFATPTANVNYTIGAATAGTYNICTAVAASCSSVYQAAGSYLAKNAIDTSSATLSAGQTLLSLSNNGGTGSTTLSVNNGGASGNALYVTAAANPGAGTALITANNTTGAPSGNLLDLQASAVSKFSVNYQGNVTSGTINSQTISAAASFTGTITSASTISTTAGGLNITGTGLFNNALTASGAFTASAGASVTGGLNNNSGTLTNTGTVSGITSLTFTASGSLDTAGANTVSIGTANATGVTIGRAAGSFGLQGSASSATTITNGGSTMQIGYVAPTANIVYQFGNATVGTYQICTSYASSCGTTYAPYLAGGYVNFAPASAQTDATANTSLFINKTAGTQLVNLQASGSTVFAVQTNGTAYLGGSSSSSLVTVDTASFRVKVGTGTPASAGGASNATGGLYVSGTLETAGLAFIGVTGNAASFDASSHEVTFSGTARHQKSIRLTAEYAGAVLDSGGQSAVTGTMTAGYDATQRFGYYKWTSGLASANTYDVVATIPLPDDWAAWNGNPSFKTYATSIAAGNTVQIINMTRTDGTADGTFVATPVNITPGSTSTWATYNSKGLDSSGYSAGGSMTIRIRMSSLSSSDIRLGDIVLPYYSRY